MGRAPCCDKANVKKGPWSPEEDAKLKSYIEQHGTGGNWIALPQKIGLKRCGKSCRLRWLNYLRPNIKHGGFSEEEDSLIYSLHASIGSRWSIIAAQLPGRTDNDIKNYWNTKLKKKLLGKQRKEHGRQGHNNGIRKRGLKYSSGSINRRETQTECPSSFMNSNQINPSWLELPAATQTVMPHSDFEVLAVHGSTSIRKLLTELGGRFLHHDDQVAIQNGPPSFHQYSICQSSSSPSQNPNYDHEASVAMLSSATVAAPQPGGEQAGIAFPCTVEETWSFANLQKPVDRLEFLIGEGIDTAACAADWYNMNSIIYPPCSSYGLGIQNGQLQDCGFINDLRYSTAQ